MHYFPLHDRARGKIGVRIDRHARAPDIDNPALRCPCGRGDKDIALAKQHNRHFAAEHMLGGFDDSFEHGPRVGRRLADDAQDFRCRGLPLQRLLGLIEQPRVLHRDQPLRGEGLHERDLLFGERLHVVADEGEDADDGAVFAQGHADEGANLAEFGARDDKRRLVPVGLGRLHVLDMKEGLLLRIPAQEIDQPRGGAKHEVDEGLRKRAASAAGRACRLAFDKP
jgi:hypothetical protein